MPTPPNATATIPVTAVRLDATLKARIAAAQGDLAREMPGLSPTFSDALRVLINEALDARASRAVASPPAAAAAAHIDARADAMSVYLASVAAARVDHAAALVPTGRGAGGITLHRSSNGASIATVVANDPK